MSRPLIGRIGAIAGIILLVGALAVVAKAWYDSRLPGTYNVMDYGRHDYGGGPEPPDHEGHGAHVGLVSVADLHGPATETPDARFELTARAADLRLASGHVVHALTFNGRSPGPELRVREGDLVEVTLANEDVGQGVTIHWHGVDVPNAEDGVAGVTQDAVLPGERYTYRFRTDQVGTFWYHTHQVSSEDVQRGLFGALVIEPREAPENTFDRVLVAHTFDGIATLNASEATIPATVSPGTPVRLRLVNTDSAVRPFTVSGTPFRVLAIDGKELNRPGLLRGARLSVAAGGRMDVGFPMPPSGARVGLEETDAALGLSTTSDAAPPESPPTTEFDPLSYGQPVATPFSQTSRFDRRFTLTITKKLGFFDGRPGRHWALNGGIYPDVPMFVVGEGDLVEVAIANRTKVVHPMHLHGHHALVLSRNGQAASGSPWWVDTLDVDSGDEYVIAFRADNPGIWMDHCHNLGHAAAGLTMHVAYVGVTTPFFVGGKNRNEPE